MKKFTTLVSVIFAMVITFAGMRSMSANEPVPVKKNVLPTFCIVTDTDYGINNENLVFEKIVNVTYGNLVAAKDTQKAIDNNKAKYGDVSFKRLARDLGVDYIVTINVRNDIRYDDFLHNVDITIDVTDRDMNHVFSKMGNIIVLAGDDLADENASALVQFFDEMM